MVLKNTCFSAQHTHRKKCTCTRACAPMQPCSNFFTIQIIANYLESCASIVQAVVCRTPACCLDASVDRRCSLQKIIQINASAWRGRRCRCRTSFIRSSTLVLAPSSWSMVRTNALLLTLSSTNFYISNFFGRLFLGKTGCWQGGRS